MDEITKNIDEIQLPNLPGISKMTPLQMNEVRFNKQHTVLTPELLKQLDAKRQTPSTNQDSSNPASTKPSTTKPVSTKPDANK